jgi:hypothetical protein
MKKFNPKNYTEEELMRLATIGLTAEIERALDRLPPEWRDGTVPFTEKNAKWLENYIKLNPGGTVSFTNVKVTRHEE